MTSKEAGLHIRVQRDLRDQFLDACRANDRPAAQVIREFMRSYVATHNADPLGERAAVRGQPPKALPTLKRK